MARASCRLAGGTKHRSHAAVRRGQNLVLFALFLVVLTIAVMATIGVTQQARRKMELNATADAAAYSQAVATARTFNSIALLNRAQAATMVAMTGVQSAMSFAVTYRGMMWASYAAYFAQWDKYGVGCDRFGIEFLSCGPGTVENLGTPLASLHMCTNSKCVQAYPNEPIPEYCNCAGPGCAAATGTLDRINALLNRIGEVNKVWTDLDQAAGKQTLAIQYEAFKLGGLQRSTVATLLGTRFDQVLTPSGARLGSLLAASEVGKIVAPGVIEASSHAVMGSRRHPFITRREDGQRALQLAMDAILVNVTPSAVGEIVIGPMKGNSYFATNQTHGTQAQETSAWGDEHAEVRVLYNGPRGALAFKGGTTNIEFKGWVRSTDEQDATDSHSFCPHIVYRDRTEFEVPAFEDHTLAPHQTVPRDMCPNSSCIWPDFLDVNTGAIGDAADAFGQPKAQVAAHLEKDPRAPWDMAFRFAMTRTNTGTALNIRNGRKMQTVSPVPQMVSTAIAYYHRPGHWKEPPNFFNPFWRATLVRADIDDDSLADLQSGVDANNAPWASDAVRKLMAAGYQGIP